MQKKLTPLEAIQVLDQASQTFKGDRRQHDMIKEAVQILMEIVSIPDKSEKPAGQ